LAPYIELRSRCILTAVRELELVRPYYLCSHCHRGQVPLDAQLDVEHQDLSPGVRRMLSGVGSEAPFDHGRQQMKLLAGLAVTTKAVERTAEAIGADIAARQQEETNRARQLDLPIPIGPPIPVLYLELDGTGIPMVRAETEGRPGKIDGQPAPTREVKLGCVFTQTTWDQQGFAIRDPDSTTYTGAIETAEEFGQRLPEAWNRGWSRARKKVIIGDGVEWILEPRRSAFPWRHPDRRFVPRPPASLGLGPPLLPGRGCPPETVDLAPSAQTGRRKNRETGRLSTLPGNILAGTHRSHPPGSRLQRNTERMRYPEFRCQHLFVGSGVIEAGCKTVIGSRLKQSGMFWTVRGANAIIALRCCRLSARFEDYWDSRRA
jgi:hypothetical protein